MKDLSSKLDLLSDALPQLRRGIEKEGLRVREDGTLATSAHPSALGSPLTNPRITTDFSESQLELITGVHLGAGACLGELRELHQFVYRNIGDELVWAASMPCDLPRDSAIPIAQFGTANIARAKTVYRIGLSHRYGPRMQLISGLHYNFSLPEDAWPVAGIGDANQAYMALIRNFRRHAWLLLYLFGASPAVCASFLEGRTHSLQELSPGTLYQPFATSLRMGPIGYLGAAQESLVVSCNDLESYAASLADALTKPYPPYEAIGLRDGDEYRQLSTSLLQIENEYYSKIRPKRVIRPGERPLHALRQDGVQYVEVRVMDIDPFSDVGIALPTVRFLDVFLLHCLLSESPPDTPAELRAVARNGRIVAARGRAPGLRLRLGNRQVGMRAWARRLLDECGPIAGALDAACGGDGHQEALEAARHAVSAPDTLPSARVITEIRDVHGGSYRAFALAWSRVHRNAFRSEPLSPSAATRLEQLARDTLAKQHRMEAEDTLSFESFRQRYLAPDSIMV